MAGRPRGRQSRSVVVQVRLTPDEAKVLDARRGSSTRSSYLRRDLTGGPEEFVASRAPKTVVIHQTTPPSQRPVPSPPVGEKPHRHRPGAVVNRRSDHGVMEVQYQCLTCPEVLPWRRV